MRGLMMAGALALMAGGAEAATFVYSYYGTKQVNVETGRVIAPTSIRLRLNMDAYGGSVSSVRVKSATNQDEAEYYVDDVQITPQLSDFNLTGSYDPDAQTYYGVFGLNLNPDGTVINGDFIQDFEYFQYGSNSSYDVYDGLFYISEGGRWISVELIPVPASAPLALTALGALALFRRRRTSRSA